MGAVLDQDVIIIGSGPAGLTAATRLAARGLRVLVLEKEDFGGQLKKVEWFRGHPEYPEGIGGPALAGGLLAAAEQAGVRLEYGAVDEIESFSGCRSVRCDNGRTYTAGAIIIAAGRQPLHLQIPGEQEYLHQGVMHCVLCDAGLYSNQTVAVCGGGNTGLTEALLLARYAARVLVIEQSGALTARPGLQEQALAEPKLEVVCHAMPLRILGGKVVKALEIRHLDTGATSILRLEGIAVAIGSQPATDWFADQVSLAEDASILVDAALRTELTHMYAAGDVRASSQRNLPAAIRDGLAVADSVLQGYGRGS